MSRPVEDSAALPGALRSLHLAFADAHAFRAEYERNLVKGGAFIPTAQRFALRELVEVRLEAGFANETLTLGAEVVHCLPPNGVAVQFLDPAPTLRARLGGILERAAADPGEPAVPDPDESADPALGAFDPFGSEDLAGLGPAEDPLAVDADALAPGRLEGLEPTAFAAGDPSERTFVQRAEREPVRVPVRVRGPTGKAIDAHSRNLSTSGLLLSVDGEELPVGRDVELEITHPGTGEALVVDGRVVRHLDGPGVVPAVAVQMRPGGGREAVERFVEEVHRADAEQRQGGIRGPLEELGAAGLLQMFAALSRCGTLFVTSGNEEGVVAFEGGQLVLAQVGSVTGVKALARLFAWRDGHFEFRAHVAPVRSASGAGEPMEAAIFAALQIVDEANRNAPGLAPDARFAVHRERLGRLAQPLGKTEDAVLELAAAGFTLRRILDVIPENDAQIRAAVETLLEQGLLDRAG
jgi:hypothetical protein